ncbi:MAG: chemotaxis protein CheX [Desulfovermiculus sp.]
MHTLNQTELAQVVAQATTEIYDTMIMAEIEVHDPLDEPLKDFTRYVSGIVGLAGVCQGMLAIHAPEKVAMGITNDFLGMEVESVDDDVKDAISELANMVGGSVKPVLSPNGKDIQLSLPSVFHGDYTVKYFTNAHWVIVPFTISWGQFFVELQLRRNE